MEYRNTTDTMFKLRKDVNFKGLKGIRSQSKFYSSNKKSRKLSEGRFEDNILFKMS